jgi:hypothetical protein
MIAMKKIVLLVLVAFSSLVTLAQKEIVNDPNAEVRELKGSFSSIKISGGIDLFLSQSDNEAVAVSASDSKASEGIRVEVSNGTLRIFYTGDKGWSKGNKNLRAYVSFKNLESINASGACDVQVAGVIEVPSLTLTCSGASDFKGAVKVSDLKMQMSGASDATIKGSAVKISIESTGASDVKGYELVADYCDAKASGASDISITVNKELTANASGASDITYKGNGSIKEHHASGASSVSKKG